MKDTTINIEETIQELNKQNKRIEELCLEIERLNNIISNSKNKTQEIKEHINNSNFDGMTKSILMMALNEIIYCLNGKGSDKE